MMVMPLGDRLFWPGLGQNSSLVPGRTWEFHCPPEWRLLPRILDDYTLWFVRGGAATLDCAGCTSGMTAGDLLLVPPGVVHAVTHDLARPLSVVTAHFTVVSSEGCTAVLPPDVTLIVHRRLLEPHIFAGYFSRLLALQTLRPPEWQTVASALFLVLLAELAREDAQHALVPQRERHNYPAIAQTLLRLETDGNYFVPPAALARECGFSPGHFSRIFRRQLGQTPQQYLLERRIDRARQLLLESDLSIQEVAGALGYRDVCFFTRQFTALVERSPGAFRREAKGLHCVSHGAGALRGHLRRGEALADTKPLLIDSRRQAWTSDAR